MFSNSNAVNRQMALNDFYMKRDAKKNGNVHKDYISFDQGVSEQQADEFLNLVGTHSPAGAPVRKDLDPGQQFNDGQYIVTSGAKGLSNWQSYSPGSDYTTFGTVVGLGTGGLVWRRKDAPPSTAKDPAPAPAPAPTPTSPAPRVDAGNPSLADALKDQPRPALHDALNSALRINDWRDAGGEPQGATEQAGSRDDNTAGSGRRFAASDRWRQRLEEVSGRFA